MDRTAQLYSKRGDIQRRAIGQSMLGLGPNKLVRIKFRSIGWETMDLKTFLLENKIFDNNAPMDRASIPKEHNRSAQMLKKVAQKGDDLHSGDIVRMATEVKSQTLFGRGNSNAGDDGNPVSFVAMLENRGFPDRRPSLADVRDEEKSAFIEEDEMGPKSLSFFLYAANRASSSVRWRIRPVAGPAAPVSGRSILSLA